MPHTANRHGRQVTLTGRGRRGIQVETLNRTVGANLLRGWIKTIGIRDGRAVRVPITMDYEWLDEVVGDFVDAEAALLAATAGLDD